MVCRVFRVCVVRVQSQLHPLPEKVSFGQGAAVNVPYSTAYRHRLLHQPSIHQSSDLIAA